MSRKSVTILGVKIPLANIYPLIDIIGWVSYKFQFDATPPPGIKTQVVVAPSAPSKEDPSLPIKDYNEYCDFSTFAVYNSFGNDIMEAAREQGAEYARRLNKLVQGEYV